MVNGTKSCGLQFISTLKATGFAGRQKGPGDSWQWKHFQSHWCQWSLCLFPVKVCSEADFDQPLPPQLSGLPGTASCFTDLGLLQQDMNVKKLPELTLFSWTSRTSRCFMRISTNIKPVCSFFFFFFPPIPAFVVLFDVLWSFRSCQRLLETEPLVWVRGCVFDLSDVPWICNHV